MTTAAAPGEVQHRGLITVSIMLATIMQVLERGRNAEWPF